VSGESGRGERRERRERREGRQGGKEEATRTRLEFKDVPPSALVF
jgi:hypothetical protein